MLLLTFEHGNIVETKDTIHYAPLVIYAGKMWTATKVLVAGSTFSGGITALMTATEPIKSVLVTLYSA